MPDRGGQKRLNLTAMSHNLIMGRINGSLPQQTVLLLHCRVVIARFHAAFQFLTSAIAPHVIKEILKVVLLVSYDFLNDTAGEETSPKTRILSAQPGLLPLWFDMEPPDCVQGG